MFRFAQSSPRPVEYYLLVEPQPYGRVVGYLAERPIAEFVTDAYGTHYTYAGVAPRLLSGRYDLEALRRDEWLVEPGLVYALARREQHSARQSAA
jgi:hypothetical protein